MVVLAGSATSAAGLVVKGAVKRAGIAVQKRVLLLFVLLVREWCVVGRLLLQMSVCRRP